MTSFIEVPIGTLLILLAAGLVVVFLVRRLHVSEARFRIIAENTEDIVCYHDPDGRCLYVSPSSVRVLGYDPAECPGDHVHDEDQPRVRDALAQIVHLRQTVRVTFRVRCRSGDVLWVETLGRPVVEQNEVVGVTTATRDVTARKRAEDLYRLLADSLPSTGFILYDHNLRIQVAAGPLVNRSGFSREVMEGRCLPDVFGPILDAEQLRAAQFRWRAPLSGRLEHSEFVLDGAFYENRYMPGWAGDCGAHRLHGRHRATPIRGCPPGTHRGLGEIEPRSGAVRRHRQPRVEDATSAHRWVRRVARRGARGFAFRGGGPVHRGCRAGRA